MNRRLRLFSSELERDVAFPDGVPDDPLIGVSGVGPVEAGIGTAGLIARYRPTAIVFIGTCGAYPESGLQIGEMIAASTVTLGSGDVVRREMRLPGLLPSVVECDADLSREIAGDLKPGRVVCTLGVTENDALARSLGELGEVENLELFSVLRAAGAIPTAGILGVTNIVGTNGGKEWRENYRHMMQTLVNYLRRA